MNNAKKVPRARRQPRNVNNLNKVMRIVPNFMSTIQKDLSMKDVARLAQVNRFTRDHARRFSPLEESMRHPQIRRSMMRALVGDHTLGLMDDLPPTIIDLEHLRAASRGTRQLTQREYERRGYPRQVRLLRNYHDGGTRVSEGEGETDSDDSIDMGDLQLSPDSE